MIKQKKRLLFLFAALGSFASHFQNGMISNATSVDVDVML